MEKEIILNGERTGWLVSDEGYTVDTWGRKSYGTHNKTAGYLQVNIKGKAYLMHRLVAMAFHAIPETNPDGTAIKGKLQVNHKDENPFNNRSDNLEWCDNTYNNRYAGKPRKQSLRTARLYRCLETGEIAQPAFFANKYRTTKQAVRNAANPNDSHKQAGGYHFKKESINYD